MAGRSGKRKFVTHTFAGGWATDFGPQFYGGPEGGASGVLQIPFLTNARNCLFELDGGPHKVPGTTRLNSTIINSATTRIDALYDYWRQGVGGAPAQQRMIYTNEGKIYSDNADGVFTSRKTGLQANKVVDFNQFNDLLVIASSSTSDVPMQWDQTTFGNLTGTPPRFSFSTTHKNFCWAAGDYTKPSRLYFSVINNPQDWISAGSGSIDVDLGDGDMITGLASYKNDLWVFKGPYKNSIHRISGSAPTGSDAFQRSTFVRGISAVWHRSIFPYSDDLGFVSSHGTVHSLQTTSAYGNYHQGTLTYPIGSWIVNTLSLNQLKIVQGTNDVYGGRIYITVPLNGSTLNNAVIVMDYRFGVNPPQQYPRWSLLDNYTWATVALVIDSGGTNRPMIFAGGNVGFVYKADQATRSNDGTALGFQVTTPYMTYGDELNIKNLEAVSVGMAPKNSNNMTIGWQNDANAQQTTTIAQSGGDTL